MTTKRTLVSGTGEAPREVQASSLLGRVSVASKLAMIAGLFIVAIAVLVGYTTLGLREEDTDTSLVSTAARQRTLSQRYVGQILGSADGHSADYNSTRQLFDESLAALLNGGSVRLDANTGAVTLPPAPTEAIRAVLEKQKVLMADLVVKGDAYRTLARGDTGRRTRLDDLVRVGDELDMVCNQSAILIDHYSDEKVAALIRNEWLLGLAVAIVGLLISMVIARSITAPLAQAVAMARGIAEGDLTQPRLLVQSSDEIGQLLRTFNDVLENMARVASDTRAVTEDLSSAVAEILASTQQQAASTREQAAAVHETTATMEEVSQSGHQISERARGVAASSEATSSASNAGLDAIRQMSKGMEGIRQQAEAVAENIVMLSEKTQAVGEIIATVNDIAEQSNLLALNAAIEAATAGEHGRSFSVIAGEMKNLADQSKEATVHVRSILGDIQKGITTSVMLTEEAVKRVQTGRAQVEVGESTIRQMADSIVQSVQAFQQIVAATGQQQIGFEQVARALQDIRQATEQTAVGTHQLEQAAANLNDLSRKLLVTVEIYRV